MDEAAALIRRIVEQHMASAIKREVHLRGYHPEDFALFAYGGGPTHVAGYRADIPTAVICPQAPVFPAGSSVMDIMHVYEQSGLDGIALKATVITEKMDLPVHETVGPDPSASRTTSRPAYWPEYGERRDTDVYSFDALRPGNVVTGPGIVEMEYSTIVIPPGQQLEIDRHGLGILTSAGNGTES